MNIETLDRNLREHTHEEKRLLSGMQHDYDIYKIAGYYNGIPYYSFDPNIDRKEIMNEYNMLLEYEHLGLMKQNRFEEVPMHVHDWIELNYMYSGKCTLHINNKKLELKAGQMCLIDTNAPHAISKCNEDDILINFLIDKTYLDRAFFNRLTENNFVTSFFIDALNTKTKHDNYIVFHSESSSRLSVFINQFMCEYYDTSLSSIYILDSLMTLIICELINVFENDLNKERSDSPDSTILPIIRFIERNYNTCTLKSTAEFFNLHPNYLSVYLKKHTGKTYKELVQTQRFQQAAHLLKNTRLSTSDICLHVGYQNSSFFFQKFKEAYGCTPKEYRERNHG